MDFTTLTQAVNDYGIMVVLSVMFIIQGVSNHRFIQGTINRSLTRQENNITELIGVVNNVLNLHEAQAKEESGRLDKIEERLNELLQKI